LIGTLDNLIYEGYLIVDEKKSNNKIEIDNLTNLTWKTINAIEDTIFKKRDYLGPIRLNKLHIRLLNKFGDVVDLNENDFSFSLEVSILYQ
jgi:hypothetical protein